MIFSESDNDDNYNNQKKQFDLEQNFKRLLSLCKSKLDDIDKTEMSEISHRVTSHMSESILFKIQELASQFYEYKQKQRHFDTEFDDNI